MSMLLSLAPSMRLNTRRWLTLQGARVIMASAVRKAAAIGVPLDIAVVDDAALRTAEAMMTRAPWRVSLGAFRVTNSGLTISSPAPRVRFPDPSQGGGQNFDGEYTVILSPGFAPAAGPASGHPPRATLRSFPARGRVAGTFGWTYISSRRPGPSDPGPRGGAQSLSPSKLPSASLERPCGLGRRVAVLEVSWRGAAPRPRPRPCAPGFPSSSSGSP